MKSSPASFYKLLTSIIAFATAAPAFSTEFVVESFAGTAGGPVSGNGSGSGWTGIWTGPTTATFGPGNSFIASGENAIGTASASAGSTALAGGADLTRLLDTFYTLGDDVPGGELPLVYLSFIVENPGPIAAGHEFRVSLLNGASELVSFGKRINLAWTLRDSDEERAFTSNAGNSNLGTWFAVVKLEYNGTNTIATGYLAEDSDADLDLTNLSSYLRTDSVTLTGKANFDGVRISSHNTGSARVDEIRIADDLNNVTATPDPLLVAESLITTTGTNAAIPVSIPLSNAGTSENLIISGITPGGPNGAQITIDSSLPINLPPGGTGSIDLTFTPTAAGTETASLTILSNEAATPTRIIDLIFNVQDPLISVPASTLDFGSYLSNPGPQILTLSIANAGSSEDLVISDLTVTGAEEFSVSAPPAAIAPGESVEIEVTFTPEAANGYFVGTLAILSNDFNLTVPEVLLTAYAAPANTIVATFDFDPNELLGPTLDLDGSATTTWTTTPLTDAATGTGALSAGNQEATNRIIVSGATGNHLRFSSARESDLQTPTEAGGNNESTWSTFTISPNIPSEALAFTGGEAVVQTYAFNDLGGNNQTDWTLYYSTNSGTSWTSLGTFAGAERSTVGRSGPLELRWDLSQIGTQNSTVEFILDPIARGMTNGTAAQRGTGFDNLYLTLGTALQLSVTQLERLTTDTVNLTWTGAPGSYAIDYSLDLTEGSWRELTDNAAISAGETNGTQSVTLPASETNRDRVFYRVRVAP